MSYINWKEHVNTANAEAIPDLPEGFMRWTDRITGTRYCMSPEDYEEYTAKIKRGTEGKAPGQIMEFLKREPYMETFPFRLSLESSACTFMEAARLYVLFAYLLYKPSSGEKEEFRKSAYHAFIADNEEEFAAAWDTLKCMLGMRKSPGSEVKATVLKGCAYKIKKYYLENDEIKDIRGASALLTGVGEELIPGRVGKRFIEECVIYSGGGSVFCILPGEADENLWLEMEMLFHNYTLSINSVFYQEQLELSELLTGYKDVMDRIEEEIDRRKRMKVYDNTCPESSYIKDRKLKIGAMEVPLEAEELNGTASCKLCGVRKAKYRLTAEDGRELCGSCLHKHFAGKSGKTGYFKEYEAYVKKQLDHLPENLDDISDSSKYIAVVYGDGNNMGAIMHGMDRLDAVMYFSRRTDKAAKRAVYRALQETYGGRREGCFEIIALGGDDIFLIVPAKGSMEFSLRLAEYFNNEFRNLSAEAGESEYRATLSAGVCMGKSKTPVRVMFDSAEKAMHRAKALARKNMENSCDKGSLDYVIIQSSFEKAGEGGGMDLEGEAVQNTMLPYSLDTARGMLKLVGEMKERGSDVRKSNLFRIMQAFENVESVMEGMLFYCYDQARNKNRLEKVLRDNPVCGYVPDSGFFRDKERRLYSPWRDILSLWDFYGRDDN